MTQDTIRIFLAEDHPIVREGLAVLMSKDEQMRVVGQCGDGLKVVDQVRELEPDVLVLDITMPGLSGLDICHEIVRKVKGAAVLFLTMHDEEEFIAKALEEGASGYLLKEEADGDQLRKAIRAVASGELFLGSGIPTSALRRIGRGDADPYEQLTLRERQVLKLIAEGKTNRQIAKELEVSAKTVNTHRFHLMRKLDIHDQTSLVKYAVRKGIVTVG